jgi:hypothetical protein
MSEGMFASFEHDHFFQAEGGNGTVMRGGLRFAVPLSPLGLIAERIALRRYLTRFLLDRNATSDVWRNLPKIGEGILSRSALRTTCIEHKAPHLQRNTAPCLRFATAS